MKEKPGMPYCSVTILAIKRTVLSIDRSETVSEVPVRKNKKFEVI